jgi:hypothetical protein
MHAANKPTNNREDVLISVSFENHRSIRESLSFSFAARQTNEDTSRANHKTPV